MFLEDLGWKTLLYHSLQVSCQPVKIMAAEMPELKEILEAIQSNLLLYSLNKYLLGTYHV